MKKAYRVILLGMIVIGFEYAGTRPKKMTQEEKNKTIVLIAIEASDKGDWEEWKKRVADRFVLYGPRNRKPVDREICKRNLVKQREALKDGKRTVQDIIAKDDKVVVRMKLMAIGNPRVYTVGESRKEVEYTEISIYRLEEERIVEQWVECDAEDFKRDYKGMHYGGWPK